VTDEETLRRLLGEARSTIDALAESDDAIAALAGLAREVTASLRSGGKLWLFGNGGSAADAQHIAAEFVGRFRLERPALPAEALAVNGSVITAIANDFGFGEVFARQLEGVARTADVAIGISTSGTSENVVRGLLAAQRLGLRTGALTGGSGGRLRDIVDHAVIVPATETARIQECHVVLGHALCKLVEEALAEGRG
jgi:D-sedoheptulose 7-phosphate isomerase